MLLSYPPQQTMSDAVLDISKPWPMGHGLSRGLLFSPVIERPPSPISQRLSSCITVPPPESETSKPEKWLPKFRNTRQLVSPIPKIRSTPPELWQLVTNKLQDDTAQVIVQPEPRLRQDSEQFSKHLHDTWRKNPYAPRVMSHFNPLREDAPWQYWTDVKMASSRRWNFQKEWFPPIRSRFHCDRYSKEMRPRHFLLGICRHCADCQKDTLHKKLLIYRYYRQQHQAPQNVVEISEEAWVEPILVDVEDEFPTPVIHELPFEDQDVDMPLSPILRDLDDFDSEGDDIFMTDD